MKRFFQLRFLVLAMLALGLGTLPAFAGGEHFTIYLNKKMVLQQTVLEPVNVVSLLDKTGSADQLVIHYSHCGQMGKGRQVMLKNEQGQTVKLWAFTDGKEDMSIPASEIAVLQKKYGQLTLSYSSKELPKGRTLVSLKGSGKNLAFVHPAMISPALRWLAI